jgi:hypothetical protein
LAHVKVLPRLNVVQFGETIVEWLAMAVMDPWVAVCTTTVCVGPSTDVITPVTSPTKSNAPEGRLLATGGSTVATRTLAAPRFTLVIAWVCGFTVNALRKSRLTASPVVWPAVRVKGNGVVAMRGAADPPVKVVTLPGAHPVIPCVCVQYVTTGFERLTTIFV